MFHADALKLPSSDAVDSLQIMRHRQETIPSGNPCCYLRRLMRVSGLLKPDYAWRCGNSNVQKQKQSSKQTLKLKAEACCSHILRVSADDIRQTKAGLQQESKGRSHARYTTTSPRINRRHHEAVETKSPKASVTLSHCCYMKKLMETSQSREHGLQPYLLDPVFYFCSKITNTYGRTPSNS